MEYNAPEPTEDQSKSYIADRMLYKGLSVDRTKNGCNWDYQILTDNENAGIRVYLH